MVSQSADLLANALKNFFREFWVPHGACVNRTPAPTDLVTHHRFSVDGSEAASVSGVITNAALGQFGCG